jgi:hypothetical protein
MSANLSDLFLTEIHREELVVLLERRPPTFPGR